MEKLKVTKITPAMVYQLVNFDEFKKDAIKLIHLNVNNSSISNKEDALKEYEKTIEHLREVNTLYLDKDKKFSITQEKCVHPKTDEECDTIAFCEDGDGAVWVEIVSDLEYCDYVEIAERLCSSIEELYIDDYEWFEDCGEYWECI